MSILSNTLQYRASMRSGFSSDAEMSFSKRTTNKKKAEMIKGTNVLLLNSVSQEMKNFVVHVK